MVADGERARRAWRDLHRLMEAQQRRWTRGVAELGLTMVQAHALMELAAAEPGPMSRIAAQLHVDPSWVTGLVDRLEERGDVVRRPSPSDRRVKIVQLTEQGRQTNEALHRLTYDPPAEFVRLPDDDLRQLVRIVAGALELEEEPPSTGRRR